MKKYKNAVVIMRAQPLHNAHLELISKASEQAENIVILIGSSKQPRTVKNPFTFDERKDMILAAINIDSDVNIFIKPLVDIPYNDQTWAAQVQDVVKSCVESGSICLVGHDKGQDTKYLHIFPQWSFEEFENVQNQLNATDIRELYFKQLYNADYIKGVIPVSTLEFLEAFRDTDEYENLIEEKEFIAKYKQQFASLAYPPFFVTVDTLIVQSGHALLIKRRHNPGKNLWAIPGGFIGQNELIIDAAIRELKEETKIKVPVAVLKGSIKKTQVFDHPNRSARGRTITHCFYIELPDGPLEKVEAADDAQAVKWVPIAEIASDKCFEDHFSMIQMMIGA